MKQDFWSSGEVVRRIQLLSIAACVVLAVLGLLLVSSQFSLGVLLGGLIIIFNFHWFQKALRKVFDPQMVYGTKMFYYAKYFLRLVITAVAIYLLIVYRTVHPLGLLTGLSVVVMNIMLIAFNELRKIIRTKEAI